MKDTKPFNLEHAKAGAPFKNEFGNDVTIFKFDCRGCVPLAGIVHDSDSDYPALWGSDGNPSNVGGMLVMTPLGYIDGKPVFVGDEIELKCFAPPHEWKSVKAEPGWGGTWNDNGECARWPAPTKQYPATGMSKHDLYLAASAGGTFEETCRDVANAALRHAIDNGQMVTLDDYRAVCDLHRKALADRAARDMAIAEAVKESSITALQLSCGQHYGSQKIIDSIDLSAIIAKVQA